MRCLTKPRHRTKTSPRLPDSFINGRGRNPRLSDPTDTARHLPMTSWLYGANGHLPWRLSLSFTLKTGLNFPIPTRPRVPSMTEIPGSRTPNRTKPLFHLFTWIQYVAHSWTISSRSGHLWTETTALTISSFLVSAVTIRTYLPTPSEPS